MRFVVNKVALGQVSIRVLWLLSVSVIPPMIHTRLHLYGRSLGTFQKAMLYLRTNLHGVTSQKTATDVRTSPNLVRRCHVRAPTLHCHNPSLHRATSSLVWRHAQGHGWLCLSVCLPLGHRQANEDIKNSFVNILAAASSPLTCEAQAA